MAVEPYWLSCPQLFNSVFILTIFNLGIFFYLYKSVIKFK
jgi:hypothetical protein